MYWRVRNYNPDYLVRQYGPAALLIVSLVANLFFVANKIASKPPVSKEVKSNFDTFIRQVTTHLLDTSYVSYDQSTSALRSELAPQVLQKLTRAELLPKNQDELLVNMRQLQRTKQVSAVRIDDVRVGEADQQGLLPVFVRGVTVVNSADESQSGERPFAFKFLCGLNAQTQQPIVADFSDVTQQQQVVN